MWTILLFLCAVFVQSGARGERPIKLCLKQTSGLLTATMASFYVGLMILAQWKTSIKPHKAIFHTWL